MVSRIHPAAFSNNLISSSSRTSGVRKSYDLHNISPNELDDYTLDLYKSGQITLKQRLAFVPLKTIEFEKANQASAGSAAPGGRSRVWSDPDRKRDMISAWKATQQDERANGADERTLQSTQDAIRLLEQLAGKNF